MGRIRILPDILANKIAAGEVVERPASVVKELLENALDAGGTRIAVEIAEGGRALIRVADNGSGMAPDDALMALERFATSKLSGEQDLFTIRSLGFRGEALPSIAAVSHLTLLSREAAAPAGTEIRVEGGRVVAVSERGAAPGTQVTVARLFFNLPARRKFMRSAATELAHVTDLLGGLVLPWPAVQFSLRHDGRDLRLWPSVSDPAERVAAVLGREAGGDLWPVAGEAEGRRLRGWIAHPRRFRTSSKGIFLYVNGRWVRDRGIQYALAEAFSGRLMRGQYPLAVLLLDLPCEQVDVNVHPAKSEVRLLDGRPVHALVVSAVRQALARLGRPAATPATVPQAVMEEVEPIAPSGGKPHSPWPPAAGRSVPETLWRRSPGGAGAGDGQPLPIQEEIWAEGPLGTLRVIGQLHNTYLVCEAPRDLVLIDQHAAHERIVFERLRTAHQGRGGERQGLLLPETVELSHREAARLRELLPALERLGLELEPFGGNSFAIKTLPAPLAGASAVPLVTQIAEKALASHSAWDLERAVQDCLILMACHSAVRARQQLSPEEGAALLRQLENCETPACCPHGRPTIIRWPVAALERMFKRSG